MPRMFNENFWDQVCWPYPPLQSFDHQHRANLATYWTLYSLVRARIARAMLLASCHCGKRSRKTQTRLAAKCINHPTKTQDQDPERCRKGQGNVASLVEQPKPHTHDWQLSFALKCPALGCSRVRCGPNFFAKTFPPGISCSWADSASSSEIQNCQVRRQAAK